MEQMQYRAGLPAVPERMKTLPVDPRGYPVPWFVAEIDGKFDFRIMSQEKMIDAITKNLCWVCGEKLGTSLAFTIGPMCVVNRTIGEPPAHRECAEFSVKACPFLNQTEMRRNESRLDELREKHNTTVSEFQLARQPGAICLWITRFYRPFYPDPVTRREILFSLGDPEHVAWYCQGREATRAEVLNSIETGLPILREMAASEGGAALHDLERKTQAAMKYLPPETPAESKPNFASAVRR